jgi:hypothetical protein
MTGIRFSYAADPLWRPLRYDIAAFIASFRTQVDDPIGILDYIQIMLDNENRRSGIHEPIESAQ